MLIVGVSAVFEAPYKKPENKVLRLLIEGEN